MADRHCRLCREEGFDTDAETERRQEKARPPTLGARYRLDFLLPDLGSNQGLLSCTALLWLTLGRNGKPMMAAQARGTIPRLQPTRRFDMATKGTDSGVYRVTEIIGTSNVSWEDAAKTAVETAAKSLRDLRVAEVTKLDMKIEGGKVVAYRAKVSLSFKYEA
jgi:flavin-binding protein dodecin